MTHDDRNAATISFLDPAMQQKVFQLFDLLVLIGEDVLITSGYRTKEEQDALYAKGRTKPGKIVTNARGGESMHNYGVAIDIVPVGPLGIPLHNLLEWAAFGRYATVAGIAKEIGFEWGGDWTFVDRPHLQYTQGLSLTKLRSGTRPKVSQAKQERLGDLIRSIVVAERALDNVGPSRKKRLQSRINVLKRKKTRIEQG